MPSDSSPRKPNSPIRLGKYEVLAHIATGGMGAVYQARDTETAREVALKVLTPDMAAKPVMLERFRREARSAMKLQHENIVKVYDFDEAAGTVFIAMEFVDGIDLSEHIDRHGPMDPEETREIMIQAARALKHAYEQGIVHRDVKPSNFLITRKYGRMLVKLTDLGLAREARADDFRVTRTGTTVGTVDYMAPEQARDSSLADTRSDLYALGCTWFHMLAKAPPFPDGGLAERIVKHMEAPPPDVREFNPRASKALTKVLNKLLAKAPKDRYQTPGDLLDDLLSLDPIARNKSKSGKPDADETPSGVNRGPRRSSARATDFALRPGKRITTARKRTTTKSGLWISLGIAAGLLLVAGVVLGAAFALKSPGEEPGTQPGQAVVLPPDSRPQPPTVPATTPMPPDKDKGNEKPPAKPRLPALYEPATKIDFAQLRQRIDAPWANHTDPPADAPTLRVSRQRIPDNPSTFSSIAEAFAAAPPGKVSVVEIHDNGPLYQATAVLAERQVVLRAGKGYRPLLVWDINRALLERKDGAKDGTKTVKTLAMFQVEGGELTLDGIDIVLKWSEPNSEPLALIQMTDGDLTCQNCTFSVAGKHSEGVPLVRFQTNKERGRDPAKRCLLRRCYARGGSLIALQLDAPKAEVLVDGCLIVGGEPALIHVRAGEVDPTTLRVARSTLVGANTCFKFQAAVPQEHDLAFQFIGWDALLSRTNDQIGGAMIALPGKVLTRNMKWETYGCLYAGWQNLLGGSNPIGASRLDFIRWDSAWKIQEGDRALENRFPAVVFADAAQLPASNYATANTPVEFASTHDPDAPLGCSLEALPPARDSWLPLTFERFAVPDTDVLDGAKPEIARAEDGKFHGARLELTPQFDLGNYVLELQKQRVLGPRVVLHLVGVGEQKTSPIHLKGTSLVLFFEPPPREDAKPLTLSAKNIAAEALVEIENGNLDVINGDLALPDVGKSPNYAIKVVGGDVRLHRCRVQGAHGQAADNHSGLIYLQGSGVSAVDKAHVCVINESVLTTGRNGIHLHGVGSRALLRQTALVAGEALRIDPDGLNRPEVAGRANIQCLLEQSTLAAKQTIVHLTDAQATGLLQEPVVVQAENCAFLNPFSETTNRPGMLLYEGEALSRGLIVWQSEGDFLDKRLQFGIASQTAGSVEQKGWQSAWPLSWGTVAIRKPAPDMLVAKPFDGNTWALERLGMVFALAPANPAKKKPGADLTLLGLDKKKPIKP